MKIRRNEKSINKIKNPDENKEGDKEALYKDKLIVDRFNNIIKEIDQKDSLKEKFEKNEEKEENMKAFKRGEERSQKIRKMDKLKKAAEERKRKIYKKELAEEKNEKKGKNIN